MFFIISCDNSKDCCLNNLNPYEVTIANLSKKERKISIKLYKKISNNIKSINWSVSAFPEAILSKENEAVILNVKENEEFTLYFSPYENNIEDIGKENLFYYEIYDEENKLIINKKITIKSNYLDLKSKNHWELKTDVLKVESKNFIKEINKKVYPFIKLEF
ncbi:hypothetical protein PL373_03590 (plasmid) [Tenacibaculum maritimum]|nr:hypothetical protein [Tenacibaculum maritimum]MDB0600240.1 hypothetical protein [Tenacibaculum maritimum]MDB0613665.1 hypothetical protein [Tenacibaculum maritimum]